MEDPKAIIRNVLLDLSRYNWNGASSRPKINIENHEIAEELLIAFFEKWWVAVGDIKDFFLVGHSIGGFTCGLYASRYHQYIKKLLMLSPSGV